MTAPKEITEGPWAGWRTWPHDNFETHAGPFYTRHNEHGGLMNRFVVEERHINGGGAVHGGCLLTFADYCTFTIAEEAIAGRAVTVNLSGDFLGPAYLGDVMEGAGEVTRSGGRIIYVRGMITANGKPCLSFSSILARVKPRA
jgi:acyl-coenzyme A thioesterase PaaI-like protein